MQFECLSASEIGRLVNNYEVKPTEIVEYFLNRIEKRNPSVNAFVYTKPEEAMKVAKEQEKRLSKKESLGVFAGVPFGLKDFLPNKIGWTSSHGGVECLISEDKVNSEFCSAMEQAGGIAVGKTNAPAYGFRGTTDNKLYGPTSTPFDIRYNSGGSSGGSAAAVADGLVPIAEGGDAGGSIRIPASWCNLFGFKPGVGSVPSVCRPDAWSATHPFCFNFGLTKTVEDAQNLFYLMRKYNPRDPFSLPLDKSEKQKSLGKKVALTYDFNLFPVDEEIVKLIDKCVIKLKYLGFEVRVVDFDFPNSAEEMSLNWCKALMFDSVVELRTGVPYDKIYTEQFPQEMFKYIDMVERMTMWDIYKFNMIRTNILDQFENIFEKFDFIVSPTSLCKPVLNSNDGDTKGPSTINGVSIDPLIGWAPTYLVNFIGYPAASIPAGLTSDNLPVGMQVIGKKFQDNAVLDFSRLFERVHPWAQNFEIPFGRKL